MKVLHVIPSISERSGGPGQAIVPMCQALRANGVDVLLATTDAGLVGKGAIGNGHWKEVPTIFFPVQLGQSFKYSRPFAKWLDEHVSEFDVVHIHAVFNHACIAAARACHDKGVPYILRPLGTLDPWSMKQKSLRKKVFWHSGIKKMFTNAAAIHYTSNGEQHAVEESLGLNHGVVVPLGVDLRGEHDDVPIDLPEPLFPSAKFPYVLVLSRLLPTKGLDVLLDAFLSLTKRPNFDAWRLIIAGEGPGDYVGSLKRTVEIHRAFDSVVFPGWLDGANKVAVLKNASLLALPSQHENFGLCVLESLACGVPVLISPHVNLSTEIKTAEAGWIAAVDKDAIESALAEALGSKNERLKRGAAGRNLANGFAWPVIAERLSTLYASVCAH